ncbi:hypothetical protein F4804DRAFT_168619 [Jackrogersella minutella]|nr:hypothetical protein F4804DRAFT_168619 [Jackrogersella minutella]
MKVPLLIGLSWLIPHIFALDNRTILSSPVFILKTTHPATTALSKALDTLGYSRLVSGSDSHNQGTVTTTYVEVTSDTQLTEIAKSHPEARFIIPRGSSRRIGDGLAGIGSMWRKRDASLEQESVRSLAEEGDVWLAHSFFSEKDLDGILELDVLALEKGVQAENWVRLCDFLGMGYSVVERLGLWRFPQ